MKCKTKHCRNEGKPVICNTCRDRKFKEAHPEAYAYNKLKCNAKRRGKEFDLTINEFKEFCVKTQYLRGVGKFASSFSIDRIDPDKGYTKDNIQVLTLAENSRKLNRKVLIFDWKFPEMTTVKTLEPVILKEKFKRKNTE